MADEDRVSVREFRENLSHWLDQARSGHAVTITRHGELAAQLGPVVPDVEAAGGEK